jgi:CheY-like chemotaxis protein
MQHEPFSRRPQPAKLRVLLIDDHEVSRAACRALLRTEGIDVVADLPVGEDAVAATVELHPEMAIVDVTPEDERAPVLARRLCALQRPPTVVLTSSASRTVLDPKLDGFPFIAKADLCSTEVLTAIPAHQPRGVDGGLGCLSSGDNRLVFTVDERTHVRERLLALAHADERVFSGAEIGAMAADGGDRWSDLDLTFGLADGASIDEVLRDWTARLADELDAVHLFDVSVRTTTYRVLLLPGNLQVDLSFAPREDFGALGPRFTLLFGEAAKTRNPSPPSAEHLFGLGVHHAVRARICIERGRNWQAEYWISGVRDQALALGCRRLGYDVNHGRGFDNLPTQTLELAENALVRSLDRHELERALQAAIASLLHEADEVRELADRLEPSLRTLRA